MKTPSLYVSYGEIITKLHLQMENHISFNLYNLAFISLVSIAAAMGYAHMRNRMSGATEQAGSAYPF